MIVKKKCVKSVPPLYLIRFKHFTSLEKLLIMTTAEANRFTLEH